MFFRKKQNQDERGLFEINMTPLIDVSLVLVVMLLLTTPLAFESSIAVRRSEASAKTAEKRERTERIELRIVSDTTLRLNRTSVTREELKERLRALLEQNAHRQVIVLCADNVSHGIFVDVLDRVKLSGADDIALAGG